MENKEGKFFDKMRQLRAEYIDRKMQVNSVVNNQVDQAETGTVTLRDGTKISQNVYDKVKDAIGLPDNRHPRKKYQTPFQGWDGSSNLRMLGQIAARQKFNEIDLQNLEMAFGTDRTSTILQYLKERDLIVFSGDLEDKKIPVLTSLLMNDDIAKLIRSSLFVQGDPFRGDEHFALQDPLSQAPGDNSEAKVANTGGIDFKARNMNVDVKGEGVDFQLPEDMQGIDLNNIEGLTPVIINVTPVTNMPAYLGLSEIPVGAGTA
jgi:hypothetical protein